MALRYLAFVVAAVLIAFPAAGAAQTSDAASIAGVVRDASGAVLPGVTVEVTSPALIEKVRTVDHRRRRASTASSTCGPASIPSPSRCPASAPSGVKASS